MRIVILTCATGGGHLRAAAALEKYIKETTDHEVIQMDFLKSIGKLLDKTICDSYLFMAKKTPALFGRLYKTTNRDNPLADFVPRTTELIALQLYPHLEALAPDVIISVHPFATEMVSSLKEDKKITCPLICIMTAVPRIPIPLGYAHLGDAFIVLAVLFAGRREGIWAAGIGSALADLLGGFPIWIVPTLIIKSVMAFLLAKIACDAEGNCRVFSVRTLIGVLVCMAWMVFGYTIAGAVLYGGLAAGLSSTPGLAAKAVVNTVIAYAAGGLLEKAGFRRILARQA